MMTKEAVQQKIREAVEKVRKENPLAPSITNTVTINLVANVQLALGGSAAMVYLPDEGEGMAAVGGAMYINMGKNMRQTVKETVELLKESTEKRFFYAEGRTTS